MTFLWSLAQRFGLTALKWAAVALAVLLVLLGTRSAGRNAERVDRLEQTLKNVRKRDEVENAVRRAPDGAAAKLLLERWSRD